MGEREIYFHVGMPKTGTSALQSFLAANRRALLDLGVNYLELVDLTSSAAGISTTGNAGPLAASVFGAFHGGQFSSFSVDQEIGKLRTKLAKTDARKVILSSELFWRASEQQFAKLVTAVKDMDFVPKYVIYLREQVSYLISAAIQSMKLATTRYSLEEVVRWQLKANLDSLYNDRALEKIEQLFGSDNLIVRVYENNKLFKNNVFDDFLSILGIELPAKDGLRTRVNYTPCVDDLEFIIMSNAFGPTVNFREAALETARVLDGLSNDRPRPRITRALFDLIREQFRESNAVTAHRYFGGESGGLFADPIADVVSADGDFGQEETNPTRTLQLLTGLVVRQERVIGELRAKVLMLSRRLGRIEIDGRN
jgi:hypothetical protein